MVFLVSFIFLKCILQADNAEPDQTPQFAVSGLALQSLSMSHANNSWLKWVKRLTQSQFYHDGNKSGMKPRLQFFNIDSNDVVYIVFFYF